MKPRRVPGTTTRRTVRALFLVPDPEQLGLDQGERLALSLRRDATVTGRCVCGATAPPPRFRAGELADWTLEHEHGCPAADGPHLERLAARLGDELVLQVVAAEIEVA